MGGREATLSFPHNMCRSSQVHLEPLQSGASEGWYWWVFKEQPAALMGARGTPGLGWALYHLRPSNLSPPHPSTKHFPLTPLPHLALGGGQEDTSYSHQ